MAAALALCDLLPGGAAFARLSGSQTLVCNRLLPRRAQAACDSTWSQPLMLSAAGAQLLDTYEVLECLAESCIESSDRCALQPGQASALGACYLEEACNDYVIEGAIWVCRAGALAHARRKAGARGCQRVRRAAVADNHCICG